MNGKHIQLNGTVNTRDMVGFITDDGRKISPDRLIRTEHFARITKDDEAFLSAQYTPATIVDLRASTEAAFETDILFPGSRYIHLPILRDRKELQDAYNKHETLSFGARMEKAIKAMDYDVLTSTIAMYDRMMRDYFTVNQYRRFFEILLAQEKGTVLWHCSAGKDRTGMAAALVLMALGVNLEAVRNDYLDSNHYLAERTERFVQQAADDGMSEKVCRELRIWCGVCPEYFDTAMKSIQTNWDGIEGFLMNGLGLTVAKRRQLKHLYLE